MSCRAAIERRWNGIMKSPSTVHLIVGGYPPGSRAAHDMDFVRLRLLHELAAFDDRYTTVSSDYANRERWLAPAGLLVTYVAGPVPSAEDHAHLRSWLEAGGRWLALHGTSGAEQRASNARADPGASWCASRTTTRSVGSSSTTHRSDASPWTSSSTH